MKRKEKMKRRDNIMLIDEKRLNDFFEKHYCDIDRKAKTLEDSLIYVNHETDRWESVLEQIKTDIELEKKWDELEDVLFVENNNGDLVLHEDWDKYKAGTLREDIWADMFAKYSDKDNLAIHPVYNDYEILIKIPYIIRDMFVNGEIAIEIRSKKEKDSLLEALKRIGAVTDEIEYDSAYSYYFMDSDINDINAYRSIKGLEKEFGIKQVVSFKDFYKYTEPSKVPEIIKNMFLNRQIVIKIDNAEDAKILYRELKAAKNCKTEYPYFFKHKNAEEYDPRYPYYYMDTNEYLNSNVNMENIVKQEGIRQLVDFKNFDDIQKVTEDKQQTKLKNNTEIDRE
jgi:hypothetical protein